MKFVALALLLLAGCTPHPKPAPEPRLHYEARLVDGGMWSVRIVDEHGYTVYSMWLPCGTTPTRSETLWTDTLPGVWRPQ